MPLRSAPRRVAACVLLLALTGCGSAGPADRPVADPSAAGASGEPASAPKASPTVDAEALPEDLRMPDPGRLTKPLLSSDVLVYSQDSLSESSLAQLRRVKGVVHVEQISMGTFQADEREVTYAAVDPATFRRFAMPGTAQSDEVWKRVAGGEIAVEPALGKRLDLGDGFIRLGNDAKAQRVHIGAYAPILDPKYARRIDAVVSSAWAERLGMRPGNAAIVSMGVTSPQAVRKQLTRYAGAKASVQILGPDLDLDAPQIALPTGGDVAAAVGSFSYRANPDGTVTPDASWVSRNIVTMDLPIIGRVTGHRVMLPQLRAALQEVVARGLSKSIYTYDGCYVPRFIARDPSKGLSFHTYGTAIDLNARDNYRGIPGKMDRQVVAIFKKWGFAWGGDWRYTDPMHFELAELKRVGG